jgi:hypothetical protein
LFSTDHVDSIPKLFFQENQLSKSQTFFSSIMEVASPIPFNVTAGAKRRLACSPLDTPGLDAHDNYGMDDSGFGQTFKRRRCDDMEMIPSNPQPLAFNNTFGQQSVFGKSGEFLSFFEKNSSLNLLQIAISFSHTHHSKL